MFWKFLCMYLKVVQAHYVEEVHYIIEVSLYLLSYRQIRHMLV